VERLDRGSGISSDCAGAIALADLAVRAMEASSKKVLTRWSERMHTRVVDALFPTRPHITRAAPMKASVRVKKTAAIAYRRTGCPEPNRRNARNTNPNTSASVLTCGAMGELDHCGDLRHVRNHCPLAEGPVLPATRARTCGADYCAPEDHQKVEDQD